MKLPKPPDLTKELADFKDEITAIRAAVERLVEIEERRQ